MAELSLRDKLDSIEACEVLARYCEADINAAIDKQKESGSEEGLEAIRQMRGKLERYNRVKITMLRSLEHDPILLDAMFYEQKHKVDPDGPTLG